MNGSSDTNSRHKTLAERDCNGNQWSYAARNLFNFFQRQINHGIILSFVVGNRTSLLFLCNQSVRTCTNHGPGVERDIGPADLRKNDRANKQHGSDGAINILDFLNGQFTHFNISLNCGAVPLRHGTGNTPGNSFPGANDAHSAILPVSEYSGSRTHSNRRRRSPRLSASSSISGLSGSGLP